MSTRYSLMTWDSHPKIVGHQPGRVGLHIFADVLNGGIWIELERHGPVPAAGDVESVLWRLCEDTPDHRRTLAAHA